MLDPYSLLVGAISFLAVAAYLGIDIGPVLLRSIDVPARMEQAGYASSTFTHLVLEEIQRLHFMAGADYVGASVQELSGNTKVSIAGTEVSLTELSIQLARKTGAITYEFSGAVVERDGKLVLMLTGHGKGGEQFRFVDTVRLDDAYTLVEDAAKDIVGAVDPYAMMKLQFETDKANGDFTKTLSMIQNLFQILPTSRYHFLYNLAGRAYDLSGQTDLAIDAYRKAIRYDPRYSITYSNLALTLRKLGRIDEADEFDRKALRYDPYFYMFFRYWADEYYRAGYWDRCAYNYARFVRYVQNDARAYYDLGICEKQLGHTQESREALDRAASLDPVFATLPFAPAAR